MTMSKEKFEHILAYAKQQQNLGVHHCNILPDDMVEIMEMAAGRLERRERDKQEPFGFTDGERHGMCYEPRHEDRLRNPQPLYRSAPPAPVVPDLKELEAILDWILMLPCPTPKATHFAKRLAVVIDTCRAAMLNGG